MQRPQPRTLAILAMLGVALGTFGFFRVRATGTLGDTVLVAPDTLPPDSLAARDSVQRADSLAAAATLASADSVRADSTARDSAAAGQSTVRYRAGEDPAFAARKGWPVDMPAVLPG